jgi:alkylhydroperoxidase family enzyme
MERSDEGEIGFPPGVTRRMKAMSGLHAFVHGCGLDPALLELVKVRASQINGCGHTSTCM